MLPGQGAQWIGMARELIAREPAFRAALERCDQAARRFVDWSIMEQLAAAPDFGRLLATRIDVIQPVLVALAIAYAELLRSVGSNPMRSSGTAWERSPPPVSPARSISIRPCRWFARAAH